MLVVIRADASYTIGSGHIMRCLALAERLRLKGADVSFICRDLQGNLTESIKYKGFKVYLLSADNDINHTFSSPEEKWLGTSCKSDAEETIQVLGDYQTEIDLLIVDHYGIDYRWESYLRALTRKLMVIDDLANRKHNCDILLDQNYYPNLDYRYKKLVSMECTLFLGPRYLLLRDEFYQARSEMKLRNGKVSRVLVFYGGADVSNETEKCLIALKDITEPQLQIDVVTGCSNPNRNRIRNLCSSMPNVHYYCQISNMAKLINKADLAFGAGGSTMWERCYLGLPSIVTITAYNQRETTQAASEIGAIWNLGWFESVSEITLRKTTELVLKNKVLCLNMQEKSLQIVEKGQTLGVDFLLNSILG